MSLPRDYRPLSDVLGALPRTLRESVISYLERVDEQTPVIFERAGASLTAESHERFILACAIRKVWVTVDSQYWTVTSAVSLMRGFDLREAAIGSARYGPNTPDYQSIISLRAAFSSRIAELGLSDAVFVDSLADIAQVLS